ncbi:MAG: metallophosphoesterase family protein, partial [Acidimicrobiia bacterium]
MTRAAWRSLNAASDIFAMPSQSAMQTVGGQRTERLSIGRPMLRPKVLTLTLLLFTAIIPTAPAAGVADTSRPSVTVNQTRDVVLDSPIRLSGIAADNVGVDRVRVSIRDRSTKKWLQPNGTWRSEEHRFTAQLHAGRGAKSTGWSWNRQLPAGSYFANIRVADAAGNSNAVKPWFTFTVTNGDSPPDVTTDLESGTQLSPSLTIRGRASDDNRVSVVRVGIRNRASGKWLQEDGRFSANLVRHKATLSQTGAEEYRWEYSTTLPAGKYAASIVARDSANQSTELTPWVRFRVATQNDPAVFIAAGDVASCSSNADTKTANLIDRLLNGSQGTVALLGDGAYNDGTPAEYRNCYDPTWGRHKDITRPVPGNHDYNTNGASGYFGYFGDAAGQSDKGYYAYNAASWRVIALNSQCDKVGGCGVGSRQYRWLASQLESTGGQCILAYAHRARFSSGPHSDATPLRAMWDLLHESGADLMLAGHNHNYQRFAKMDADGNVDSSGIRSFIVGTGGIGLRPATDPHPNMRVHNASNHGVLLLELAEDSYDWSFVATND